MRVRPPSCWPRGFWSTHLSSNRQPIDDLPHLVDQEYSTVSQTATALIKETMATLETRIPAMREYNEMERQRTAEDVAHIVKFLVAGLYTDDDELFTGFILWNAAKSALAGEKQAGDDPQLNT